MTADPRPLGAEGLDYALTVNGRELGVDGAWLGESLLYVLRERLGLPGSKNACDQGECGSCSLLMDGVVVTACCVMAADAVDADLRTVEGLAADGGLTDVQQAFLDAGAVQCGFCTPGLIVAVHDLLDRSPAASELELREAVSGNLCRCTGYGRVWEAVRAVRDARGAPMTAIGVREGVRGGIGESVDRPDGTPKVTARSGSPATSTPTACCGAGRCARRTRRARIRGIDISGALAIPGVATVLTADDVPGAPTYGLEHHDQPVFARDVVRFQGEPLAAVAADHPETALACRARRSSSTTRCCRPVTDPEAAITAPPIHPDGNVFRAMRLRHGSPDTVTGDVVVEGTYEVGMQDQAFLGPESGLAIPADDGGVDLYISTQWLHVDRDQVAACLGLPPERVRLSLAGVGGAFGAREDVSLQVHVCLLALRTGRAVKMLYSREESFLGHVHRHPARISYRHHATRDGDLVKVEGRIVLDGGAYASSSTAVISNAVSLRRRPVPRPARGDRRVGGAHEQPALRRDARLRRGADLLRARGADGQARRRARHRRGRSCACATPSRPATRCSPARSSPAPPRSARSSRPPSTTPLPPEPEPADDAILLPGGTGMTATRGHVRRGVGLRRRLQEPHVLRGLRRLLHRRGAPRARRRRRGLRDRPLRRRRGRAGLRDARPADRAHRAGRHPRPAARSRHRDRVGRARPAPRARPG